MCYKCLLPHVSNVELPCVTTNTLGCGRILLVANMPVIKCHVECFLLVTNKILGKMIMENEFKCGGGGNEKGERVV
jgi:hypothetical protein